MMIASLASLHGSGHIKSESLFVVVNKNKCVRPVCHEYIAKDFFEVYIS